MNPWERFKLGLPANNAATQDNGVPDQTSTQKPWERFKLGLPANNAATQDNGVPDQTSTQKPWERFKLGLPANNAATQDNGVPDQTSTQKPWERFKLGLPANNAATQDNGVPDQTSTQKPWERFKLGLPANNAATQDNGVPDQTSTQKPWERFQTTGNIADTQQQEVPTTTSNIKAKQVAVAQNYTPTLWEQFTGLLPANKERASNELAARRYADEHHVSVDSYYNALGGSRPMLNPEGRAPIQALAEGSKEVIKQVPDIVPGIANATLRTARGGREHVEDQSWLDKAITATDVPADPNADPNYSSLQGLGKSAGYSLNSLAASLAVGIPASAATTPAGGVAAGMAASGAVSFRGSKDQFLDDALSKLQQESLRIKGRKLTDAEWALARDKLSSAATEYGLWEAVPEAIGNAATLGTAGKLAKNTLMKGASDAVKKSALKDVLAGQTVEHVTETITGLGQNNVEYNAGLTKDKLSVTDAFKQQFLPTLLLSGGVHGTAKAIGAGKAVLNSLTADSKPVATRQLALIPVEQARKLQYNDPLLDDYAIYVEQKYQLPAGLMNALKNAGERSNSHQTSPVGAKGVMQFMPENLAKFGVKDPTNPSEIIDAAGRYLHQTSKQYGGNVAAMIADYNGGPRQARHVLEGGKPTAKETAAYLERVTAYMQKNQGQAPSTQHSNFIDANIPDSVVSSTTQPIQPNTANTETIDTALSNALSDVQPAPMLDFSLDNTDQYEADLQADLDNYSMSSDDYQYDFNGNRITHEDEYARLEREAIQAESPLAAQPNIEDPVVDRISTPDNQFIDVPFARPLPSAANTNNSPISQAGWQPAINQQDGLILSQAVQRKVPQQDVKFTAMNAPKEFEPTIRTLQQAFGKKVVFVQGSGKSAHLFNGAIVPSRASNRIFVNVAANAGYMNVVGHELYEHLKIDRPDLHQFFNQVAQVHFRNVPKYQQRIQQTGEQLSSAEVHKELLADFTGDALADPQFLKTLRASNPSKFKQFTGAVMQWLESLLAKVQGKQDAGSREFIKNVNGLREHLKAVLSDYASNHETTSNTPNTPDTPDADVQFMRRIPDTPHEAHQTYKAVLESLVKNISDNKLNKIAHDIYLNTKDKGRETALYMMSFNGLIDRYHHIFKNVVGNPLKALEEHKRLMRAVNMHWADRFQKAHDKFTALSAEHRQRVSMMMYDATMLNLHPDQDDYHRSINIPWAEKRIKSFKKDLADIERDQFRQPNNRAMNEKEALQATHKAQRGIEVLQRRIEHEQKRFNAYPELHQRWNALSRQEQAVYSAWKKELTALWEKQSQALEQKLADIQGLHPADVNLAKGFITQLRNDYRKRLQLGAYFPLRRFGKHMVLVRDGDAYERAHFERASQANDFIKSLTKERPNAKVLYLKNYKDGLGLNPKDVPGVAGKLLSILNQQGIDIAPNIRETVNKFIIDSLPEVSARKPELRRYYVAGASQDMERGFAHTILHGAHDLSRILFGHKIQAAVTAMSNAIEAHENLQKGIYRHEPLKEQALQEVAKQIDVKHFSTAEDVLNVVRKQVDELMNPNTSPIAAFLGNFAFVWYLAGSPAAGLLNLVQTAQVSYPVLAAKFGGVKAAFELTRGLKDVIRAATLPNDVRNTLFKTADAPWLPADEREMLKALELDGTTDVTQANSLASAANGEKSSGNIGKFALRTDRAMAYLGWFFHNAEVINRQATQLAAYRLYKSSNDKQRKELNDNFGHEGTGYARWVTERTHFDYGRSNRSLFLKSNLARGVFPLKNYSFMMIEFLTTRFKDAIKHEDADTQALARKELSYTLGMTALFTGMSGLPVMWLMYGLANALGDDDKGFDAEAAWAQWLDEQLGETGKDVVIRGPINTFTGIDLSSRVGLANLLFNDPGVHSTGADDIKDRLIDAMGVGATTMVNFASGLELISKGETQKGIEKLLPKFLRDMSKAERYAKSGLTTAKHDELIAPGDFNPAEIAATAIGFSPAAVTSEYDKRERLDVVATKLKTRHTQLMNAAKNYYLDARGDIDSITQEIADFNVANPGMKITRAKINVAVKNAKKARLQKENAHGLSLDKRLKKQLEQDGHL